MHWTLVTSPIAKLNLSFVLDDEATLERKFAESTEVKVAKQPDLYRKGIMQLVLKQSVPCRSFAAC
jgi:hypothetical protein